jgi:hypothetical protein
VNHDRQAASPGEADLLAEHLLLRLARREIVVIVEADFANRARQRLGCDGGVDLTGRRSRVLRELPGRVWMDADGKPHVRPAPADFPRLRQLRLVVGGEDDHRVRQAGAACARDDRIEIASEFRSGDVAVRVDHRTRQPGSTVSSNVISVGLPPSGLAASTMPLDSMPISLAGLRLNTMAMVFPTSCSG